MEQRPELRKVLHVSPTAVMIAEDSNWTIEVTVTVRKISLLGENYHLT
jgi:hypothetical protein